MMLHFLRLLVQITLAPRNGWHDLRDDGPDWRAMFYGGFMPVAAVSALCGLFQLVYHPYLGVVVVLEKAVIQFVAIFVTYYIAEFFMSLYLLRNISGSLNATAMRLYIMMTVSVLSLTFAVINLVPFSPVLMLLPLYVIVVMRMADGYLSVRPDRLGHFMLLSVSTIFLPPLIIMFLFGYLTRQIV